MATLTELQDYYADTLIIQYRDKDNARNTIKMIANLSLCDGLMLTEPTCFDLDTAIGAQLTILGKIVGVPRNVLGLDLSHTFWAFRRYADVSGGVDFLRYTETPDPLYLFSRYQTEAFYTLSDFELRTLIKIKIISNNTYESYKDVLEALWNIFGANIQLVDNKDMTITYNAVSAYSVVMTVAEYLDILPRPMGVGVNVNILSTNPLLDQDGTFLLDQDGNILYEQ
ncbi:DUF2612 domain-containing protein [Candidatus Dependentiae bacterium]|nr:MAG: DUF2612 domain-containing protein [Candidatus Dependentiae bacterium]